MAAEIKESTGMAVTVTPGSRGQFDVQVDGTTIFSKARERRFPEPGEVGRHLKRA